MPLLPQHGFARTSPFRLLQVNEPDNDNTEVVLQLKNSPESLHLWPLHFEIQVHINIAASLRITLTTVNHDSTPMTISAALHSYFAVSDIENISVKGLENTTYWDALTNEIRTQNGIVTINKATDRVYQNVYDTIVIGDHNRQIDINSQGSGSAIVWNPWIDKSRAMSDMTANSYKTMLCIETANAREDKRKIAPGKSHSLTAILSSRQLLQDG